MKTEQLTWTDEQWAAHLGCSATDIPRLKKYVVKNYSIGIRYDIKYGVRFVEIRHSYMLSSGNKRWLPMFVLHVQARSFKKMTDHVNNYLIPFLELTENEALEKRVPSKLLQMLHMKNNNKTNKER